MQGFNGHLKVSLASQIFGGRGLLRAYALVLLSVILFGCKTKDGSDDAASGKALLEAVKAGDDQRAAVLLTEGVFTEIQDEKGDTPFLYAVKRGRIGLVKVMLEHDVDRKARSGNGKGALEIALDSGNLEMVKCLLKGGTTEDVANDRDPLILKATRFRDEAMLRLLLKNGVDPNSAGRDGSTALHVAAEDGLAECMSILLKAGADVNAKDDEGKTPIWRTLLASRSSRRMKSLKRLLEAGADVNIPASDKRRVLEDAVLRGYYKESLTLINYGAEVDLPSLYAVLNRKDIAQIAMLLSRGADGFTVIQEAMRQGDTERVKVLLEADYTPEDRKGGDGLVAYCVRIGDADLLDLALRNGADPNAKGKEGQRPLHMLVAMRDSAMLRRLLEHGADPNIHFSRPVRKEFLALTKKESMRWFLRKDRRLTPLMMAANNGDLKIIDLLVEYGARRNVYSGKYHFYPINFASRRGDVKAMQVILGKKPHQESLHAVLDLSEQRVRVYNAENKVIFSSRVSTGKRGYRTPKGTFVITDKHRSHHSTIYGSSMPYFQRLSCSSFGFHSGNCPGYAASHGCIRMPYRAARRLFSITPVGTRVVIKQ